MVLTWRAGARVAVVACAVAQAGCVAAVAGGAAYGAYKYAKNDGERDFQAGLDATWQAAIASLQESGHPIAAQATHGATSGVLSIEDVTVRVEAHATGVTRVRIRVGTFDTDEHRRRANLIMAGIATRLGVQAGAGG